MNGEYPDGVFDFVVRNVRGRIECHKDSAPAKPPSSRRWVELARWRLTPAETWVSISELEKAHAQLLRRLQFEIDQRNYVESLPPYRKCP